MPRQLVIFTLLFFALHLSAQESRHTLLFIGTYTGGQADTGIYVYTFNSLSGKLNRFATGEKLTNPSFLNISTNGRYLYACTNSKLPEHGKVAAFRIDSTQGKILPMNTQSSQGENPVYLSADKTNSFLVNANYTEGNISLYRINKNGEIADVLQVISFRDSSVIKSRQEKPHLHAAVFSPDNRFVFFPDLGSDKIRVFAFHPDQSPVLENREDLEVRTIPGSGPRHFTFHPSGQFAYCIEELSGTVSVYAYKDGKLDSLQRVFSYAHKLQEYSGADIHVSPDGLFLYASNREENSISIFSIRKNTGRLTLIGHQTTFGEHPRNFAIDPSGNFLLVANLVSNTIVVFRRNIKTGKLTKTNNSVVVPRPSCLQMRVYEN